MSEEMGIAERSLKSVLEKEGLCVWSVSKLDKVHKLGLLWGVTLSWPGEKSVIRGQVETVKKKTEQIAQEHGLKANYNGPTMAAGGTLVIYCGFETSSLALATAKIKRAEQTNLASL